MAETSMAEFHKIAGFLHGTECADYRSTAQEEAQKAQKLIGLLQV